MLSSLSKTSLLSVKNGKKSPIGFFFLLNCRNIYNNPLTTQKYEWYIHNNF